MDISNINGISTGDIKSFFNNTSLTKTDKTDSFSDVLSAAMGSIGETNDLQNAADRRGKGRDYVPLLLEDEIKNYYFRNTVTAISLINMAVA